MKTGVGLRTVLAGMDEILGKLRELQMTESEKENKDINKQLVVIIDEMELHCAELSDIIDELDGIYGTITLITEN